MNKMDIVLSEIEEVPEPFLDEILDFIHFLKSKITRERLGIAIISESSLRKDWLKSEEEKAWQNL